jgi:hypothetical protein
MKVVEAELTDTELFDKIRQSLMNSGWIDEASTMDEPLLQASWREMTDLWNGITWPVGTIVEKRGDVLKTRRIA